MNLELLPVRTAGAAENMALDFLLLQRHPRPTAARFRHYEWRAPAFTFGYSQKISFVRSQLPPSESFDLCRRPTGGGVVDHRDDWTYTFVIPRGHALEEARAAQSYRSVHDCLAAALCAQGTKAIVKSVAKEVSETSGTPAGPAGVCFESAELHDVVNGLTGEKISGAAQKRNKQGMLFQGSIWKPSAGGIDWERFHDDFASLLATTLVATAVPTPWPDLNEDEVEALTEKYSSPEWMDFR